MYHHGFVFLDLKHDLHAKNSTAFDSSEQDKLSQKDNP